MVQLLVTGASLQVSVAPGDWVALPSPLRCVSWQQRPLALCGDLSLHTTLHALLGFAARLQELDDILKEYDMKRDSVEINRDALQWSHHTVWNRKYIEPRPGYTLEQLWANSEPAISKKTTTSYDVQTNDVQRAVAAIQHFPSPVPPDSPFIRTLGTPAALKAPPQTDTLAQRALEEWETHCV